MANKSNRISFNIIVGSFFQWFQQRWTVFMASASQSLKWSIYLWRNAHKHLYNLHGMTSPLYWKMFHNLCEFHGLSFLFIYVFIGSIKNLFMQSIKKFILKIKNDFLFNQFVFFFLFLFSYDFWNILIFLWTACWILRFNRDKYHT